MAPLNTVTGLATGAARFTARTTLGVAKLSLNLLRDHLPIGGSSDDDRYAPSTATSAPPRAATPRAEPAGSSEDRTTAAGEPTPPTAPEPEKAAGDDEPAGAAGHTLAMPIEDYDTLTADQVVSRLGDLDATELATVEGYERAGRNRKRVLDRVAALRRRRTDEELSEVVAAEPDAS